MTQEIQQSLCFDSEGLHENGVNIVYIVNYYKALRTVNYKVKIIDGGCGNNQ